MVAPRERIGPYVVDERLAQGGSAEILSARDERTGEIVALKRALASAPAQLRAPELFRREARIARALDHPNIVRTLGALEDAEGNPVLVMELLHGFSCAQLAPRLRRSKDAVQTAIDIACSAARALDYLHRQKDPDTGQTGLIHRDVSPDNLFVTDGGDVKLIDMGLAKHNRDTRMTGVGMLKGKLSFMSPEQVNVSRLDARTDQYSLATTLYWLLTGVCPFERENVASTLDAVINAPLTPASSLEKAVPPALDAVLARAMDRDRERRYSDCAELCISLLAAAGQLPARRATAAMALVELIDRATSDRLPTTILDRDEVMKPIAALMSTDEQTIENVRPTSDTDHTPPVPRTSPPPPPLTDPELQQLWPPVREALFRSVVHDDGTRALLGAALAVLVLVFAALIWHWA